MSGNRIGDKRSPVIFRPVGFFLWPLYLRMAGAATANGRTKPNFVWSELMLCIPLEIVHATQILSIWLRRHRDLVDIVSFER